MSPSPSIIKENVMYTYPVIIMVLMTILYILTISEIDKKSMQLCELNHSHDVCQTTLR